MLTNFTHKIVGTLLLVVGIAVAARVVVRLLGPLLPSLTMLAVLVVVFRLIFRGPHGKK